MKHHPRHNVAGFTLMELIVSIAIVSFMLFLINRIFFDTAEAVSRGIATSKVIANTRTVGEQMEEDFASIKGPNSGAGTDAGFLIIVNKRYDHMPYLDGRDKNGIVEGDRTSTGGRSVRSDQLCFIRDASSLTPITITDTSSSSFSGTSAANNGRVWYGHVRQYADDGTLANDIGIASTPDSYPTHWVLGRQMLFLEDSATVGNTHAQYGVSGWSGSQSWMGNFYLAQSDVLNKKLRDTSSPFGILEDLESVTTRSDYVSKLYGSNVYFVFRPDSNERLVVRTTPSLTDVSATKIPQMHPYFLNNTSDFIVEFAGDYSPVNGSIDTTGNNIKWYGLDTALPMATGQPFELHASDDPIADPINNSNPYLARGTGSANTDSERVYVFFHNDTTYWPSLLRIRYRLHDPKGELLGTADENNDGVYDADGQPGKWYEVIIKLP